MRFPQCLSTVCLIRLFPRRCAAPAHRFSSSPDAVRPQLKVGDVLRMTRRFSAADVAAYGSVSGDRNPVHHDPDFARRIGGFDGGCIVHGMLVASLFPSVISSNFVGFQSFLKLSSFNCAHNGFADCK
ncbi:uncharacterized protein LOC110034699 [Phalaenopsis equestris]|uniref:uncharacterized protein LOC110034699 n=1 Tax=Phalaenopsis equestris TaxID=78828 RepID=UPI0009E1AA25|nr:uncharacterized protein LOC110034699 [Phalaenopsis equestris]